MAWKHCTCGCGGKTGGGDFLPGHDAKYKVILCKAFVNKTQIQDPAAAPGVMADPMVLAERRNGWAWYLHAAMAKHEGAAPPPRPAKEPKVVKVRPARVVVLGVDGQEVKRKREISQAQARRLENLQVNMARRDSTGNRLITVGCGVRFDYMGKKHDGIVSDIAGSRALVTFFEGTDIEEPTTRPFEFESLVRR